MLSNSKQIEYLCLECRSKNIVKAVIYGQQSAICKDCNCYFPWKHRIKVKKNDE